MWHKETYCKTTAKLQKWQNRVLDGHARHGMEDEGEGKKNIL